MQWNGLQHVPPSSLMLTLFLFSALLLLFLPLISSQAVDFVCGGHGYDFLDVDMTYSSKGTTYVLSSCNRPVSHPLCLPLKSSFCRIDGVVNSTVVSFASSDLQVNAVFWSGELKSAQSTGQQCGDSLAQYSTIVQYSCNASAVTPHITRITDNWTCYHNYFVFAYVDTAAVCRPPVIDPTQRAIGMPMPWPVCGAGLYDLSSLNAVDLKFTSVDGYFYYWRACALLSQPRCAPPGIRTSFCQLNVNDSRAFSVSDMAEGDSVSTTYTLTPTGLLMQQQNGNYGEYCLAAREANVWLICDPAATSPYIRSVVAGTGLLICHYTMEVVTSAVCSDKRLRAISSSTGPAAPYLTSTRHVVTSTPATARTAPTFPTAISVTSTPSLTSSPVPTSPSSSLSGGQIAGIVVGSLVGAVLLMVMLVCLIVALGGSRSGGGGGSRVGLQQLLIGGAGMSDGGQGGEQGATWGGLGQISYRPAH
jgi:hypothetical protein